MRASFVFVGEDALQIALEGPTGTRCHFGAMRYHAAGQGAVICEGDAGWRLALCAPGASLTPAHSGITFTTNSSRERLGCGLAGDPEAALTRAQAAAVLPEQEAQQTARTAWEEIFARVPDIPQTDLAVRRAYAQSWWALYNSLASPRGNITHKAGYPDRSYHNAVWLWDTCFQAVALREAEPELARDQLRVLLGNQQPDGMVPDVICDSSLYIENTKPPLIAWAAWKIHRAAPSLEFLAEIYPALCRLDDWWMNCRDPNHNGLPGYEHPFSAGTDDCPAFDAVTLSGRTDAELEGPDLAAYLYGERLILAKMAAALGRTQDAADWRLRARDMARLGMTLFDEADEFFYPRLDGETIRVREPKWLLAARLLPRERARRVLSRWLVEERCFEERYLLSTVAHDEPSYDPMRWRGGAWLNINLMVAETAAWAGLPELADEIAARSLELLASHPGLYEHYDIASGEGGGPPAFGMTAAACIEFALGRQREQNPDDPDGAGA